MKSKTSFEFIVEIMEAVNQGKLSFSIKDGLVYVKGNHGEQAILSNGVSTKTLEHSNPVDYPVIYE